MNILDKIHPSWNGIKSCLYEEPLITLNSEILPSVSYQPKREHIFRIFSMPMQDIKVVILGQDPYPIPGDAVGYAFAKPPLSRNPVSLRNIEKEVIDSGVINPSNELDLYSWIDQGVFLLNTALTVETGKAGSHLKYWESFAKKVISLISYHNPCIWLLWGNKAQKFQANISNSLNASKYDRSTIGSIPHNSYNYVLTAPHPAAEAYAGGRAGFFGCDHFYLTNKILERSRKTPIIW